MNKKDAENLSKLTHAHYLHGMIAAEKHAQRIANIFAQNGGEVWPLGNNELLVSNQVEFLVGIKNIRKEVLELYAGYMQAMNEYRLALTVDRAVTDIYWKEFEAGRYSWELGVCVNEGKL